MRILRVFEAPLQCSYLELMLHTSVASGPSGSGVTFWRSLQGWPHPFLSRHSPCDWSSDSGSFQGLYQWVYHSHEDAQQARASQGAPDEDPQEDDSGKGQGVGGALGQL